MKLYLQDCKTLVGKIGNVCVLASFNLIKPEIIELETNKLQIEIVLHQNM